MTFDVEKFIEETKKELNYSSDIASRVLQKGDVKIGIICIKSMTDDKLFFEGICKPIEKYEGKIDYQTLCEEVLCSKEIAEIKPDEVADKMLEGHVIVACSNSTKLVGVEILFYPTRIPSEPPTSQVIQGPREGFVEDIKTNITLIRKRFYNKNLIIKNLSVGEQTKTKIVVTYLKGIANKDVVKQVIKRINDIQIDGVVDSYYIAKKIEDKPHSMFKQVGALEKPDIIASKLLEGKVAIIVDGSPIVLTVPFVLLEDLQNSNDYYTNNFYATLIRFIRLAGVFIAIIIPGLYLALRLFHFNVIPANYLITIANTTLALPFTPFIEMLFINLLFQILYEVSLRLPSYLGLATSIVGALILGDTGVKAGLISPPGVIVVALSKIAVYTVPEQASQLTLLQFIFLIIGGSVGILGLIGATIYVVNYLNTLDSFGTPYLAPYSPKITEDLKDGMFKVNLNQMKKRPISYRPHNITRQK